MPDLKVLFSDLIRFETDLWNAVDARLRSEHDLPLTWFEPMQVMSKYTACRVLDIKEELSITVGGTSKLVDRIEAAGLCRRRANPDDRRSQIIEVTLAARSFRGSDTRLGAVGYAFTRSPDAADLSMAAMTSWRPTASAKSGTV